jgi:hypothetical protein
MMLVDRKSTGAALSDRREISAIVVATNLVLSLESTPLMRPLNRG